MMFMEIVAVYSEDHMKHINALSGRNAELFNVKAGDRWRNHCILAGTLHEWEKLG
jgi:hypothetical protein